MSLGTLIWEDAADYWTVAALAAGDFNEDGKDELIQGFNSSDGPAMYKIMNGMDSPPISILHDVSNYWSLGALAAGDFDADGDDELVTALNSNSQGPKIFKSELAIDPLQVQLWSSEPIYWNVAALAVEKCHGRYDKKGVCNPRVNNDDGNSSSFQGNSDQNDPDLIYSSVDFDVYPNPTRDFITIELKNDEAVDQQIVVSVTGPLGNTLMTETLRSKRLKLDLSNEVPGMYYIKIIAGSEVITKKVVKL